VVGHPRTALLSEGSKRAMDLIMRIMGTSLFEVFSYPELKAPGD